MSLEKQINNDIKIAMRAKDAAALRGLRAVKSAILLAKTKKGGGETLTEATETKIVAKMLKQRKDSAEIYQTQGREDLATKEFEEIAVIEKYMPEQMGEEEVRSIIANIVAKTGASSPKDMGRVMGLAMKELAGKADGKTISSIVRSLLVG